MIEASEKNVVAIKKSNDHWDFLEHVEAPMWVDLTLEAKSGYVDTGDDDWFNTSHPFHQLSARQLKSKFSQTGEEILTSEVDLHGLASPELPASVSRSRGKHYNSKKWEGINLNNLLGKQKGLSKRGFQQGYSFGQEVKPKSKLNVNRPKELLSAKLGLGFDRKSRGKAESMASCSNPVSSSSSVDNKTVRRTTRSTMTSENTLQQRKCREVSSQLCDQKSRSSSVRRVSLGKSFVTKNVSRIQRRQEGMEVSSQPCDKKNRTSLLSSLRKSYVASKASKVEIGSGSLQSRDRKSSSGKSSVGSCSNPGYEVKFVSRQPREKITDEKGEVTMNLEVKNQCKPGGEISKTSTISVEEANSGNRKGSNINFAKPAYRKTAKSLVQYQPTSSKALLQHKVNNENTSTDGAKEKLGTRKVNSLTAKGKENATRNVTMNQKCVERGVPAEAIFKKHRTTVHNHWQKGDTARSTTLTILGREKDQPQAKNPISLARRIYLR